MSENVVDERKYMRMRIIKLLRDGRSEKKNASECEKLVVKHSDETKTKNQLVEEENKVSMNPVIKDLPYPHAPTRKDKEKPHAWILEILKQLQFNISFLKVAKQRPSYDDKSVDYQLNVLDELFVEPKLQLHIPLELAPIDA